MNWRDQARTSVSIGSNQLSKRSTAISAAVCKESGFMVWFVMAWSPVRRFNAGWFEVDHPRRLRQPQFLPTPRRHRTPGTTAIEKRIEFSCECNPSPMNSVMAHGWAIHRPAISSRSPNREMVPANQAHYHSSETSFGLVPGIRAE
jgi:hypothetical protein